MMRTTLALLAGGFLAAAAVPADAATIWALDAGGALARIDPDSRKAMPAMAVKGADGALLAVALRPADGKLYGLTGKGQVVTIDPATGMATQVAKLDKMLDLGPRTTINFNPVVDRLRVVSSNGGNWRIHPDTGAVTVDGGLKYAPDSAYATAMPMVTSGAYSNHMAGAKETALYTLDTKLGLMNVQMPPNDGIQQPKGRMNVAVPAHAGFDILSDGQGGNTGWVVAGGALHSIDIKTGQLTTAGRITGLSGKEIVSIAVAK
jgi:hypothetical protein